MEIPKPVAIGIIVVVAIIALAVVYFLSGGGRSGEIPASAYPEYKRNEPLPDSELQGPTVAPPIAGSARGGR